MSGDSQKLLELAEKIEKAEGANFALECEIAQTVYPWLERDGDAFKHPEFGRVRIEPYTTSLDAALTLYISKPDAIPTNPRIASANALRERANQK